MSESPTPAQRGDSVSTRPPASAKSLSLEEARALIVEALGLEPPEGTPSRWWVDEAVRLILRYRQQQEGRTLYDVSSVGARIRTAREIRGLTQVQLAARLLPRRNRAGKLRKMVAWDVHGWETGNADLPYELLAPLCRSLGVLEGWLLGDTDEGGPPMPRGLRVRQKLINWAFESRRVKDRARGKAELERLRGLRGEGQRRIHHLKDGRPETPLPPAAPLTPPEVPGSEDSGAGESSP